MAENRTDWFSIATINATFASLPGAKRYLGSRCNARGSSWRRAAGERTTVVAAQLECDETTVWRACERYRRHGLPGLLADGRKDVLGATGLDFPPSNGPKSSRWPAWNRWLGGCTSRTGPVRIWPSQVVADGIVADHQCPNVGTDSR